MEFMRKFDLNFVSRVFEVFALVTFVLGILSTLFMAITTSRFTGLAGFLGTFFVGIAYTFASSVSLLFISRIGDAIDDIRNELWARNEKNDSEVIES